MEIVPFKPKKDFDNVKELFDDLIKIMEEGQAETFAYTVVSQNGDVSTGYVGSPTKLLGSIERLKYRINLGMDARE